MAGKGRAADFGLLILRLGVGGMFIVHGAPKLLSGPEGWARLGDAMGNLGVHAYPAFWGFMAGFAEGIGGLMLAVGLLTRPFAAMMFFTMVVASTQHLMSGDGLKQASHAIELGFVFFSLILTGPGPLSLDGKWRGKA